MEIEEAEFSRRPRELDEQLIASGRAVWSAARLRGAKELEDFKALELGKALAKCATWLGVAQPNPCGEKAHLEKILKTARKLSQLMVDEPKTEPLFRMLGATETFWSSREDAVRMLAAIERAGRRRLREAALPSALRAEFGSSSTLWIWHLEVVYTDFSKRKPAISGEGDGGPFVRFVQAAAAQEPALTYSPCVSKDVIRDAHSRFFRK